MDFSISSSEENSCLAEINFAFNRSKSSWILTLSSMKHLNLETSKANDASSLEAETSKELKDSQISE